MTLSDRDPGDESDHDTTRALIAEIYALQMKGLQMRKAAIYDSLACEHGVTEKRRLLNRLQEIKDEMTRLKTIHLSR